MSTTETNIYKYLKGLYLDADDSQIAEFAYQAEFCDTCAQVKRLAQAEFTYDVLAEEEIRQLCKMLNLKFRK